MASNRFRIFKAGSSHIPELAKVKVESGFGVYEFEPTTIHQQIRKIRDRMNQGMVSFVARIDGKPVAMISFHPTFVPKERFVFTKPPKGGAEVFSVFVVRERHGQRLGTRMVKRAEQEIRKLGKKRVYALVWEHNLDGIGLFNKLGYSVVGRDPNHFSNGDDSLIFLKALD